MTNPLAVVAVNVREWLNQPTPRKQMLPAYLILTVGIVLGFARFEAIAEERSQDLRDASAATAQVSCLVRVDTRESLRSVLIGITGLFDDTEDVRHITELIESDYPSLDAAAACPPG